MLYRFRYLILGVLTGLLIDSVRLSQATLAHIAAFLLATAAGFVLMPKLGGNR